MPNLHLTIDKTLHDALRDAARINHRSITAEATLRISRDLSATLDTTSGQARELAASMKKAKAGTK
jgi:hypothetical protein